MKHDVGQPLAYFITFRCYGTWLPGDARGWIDRRGNKFDTTYWGPNSQLNRWSQSHLAPQMGLLDDETRLTVRYAIAEVCNVRQWALLALYVGSNHVHVVVVSDRAPEHILNTLKAWSTRHLRSKGQAHPEQRQWSRHGSTRYLWTARDIERACQYVLEGQEDKGKDPLPHDPGIDPIG